MVPRGAAMELHEHKDTIYMNSINAECLERGERQGGAEEGRDGCQASRGEAQSKASQRP